MVKHRSLRLKSLEGSSTTTQRHRADTSHASSSSVKDKLQELRQADPAEAMKRKQTLADLANQPSIPPDVQRMLGVSVPQPVQQPRLRLRDRQRTPGPAPPSSWLRGDMSGAVPVQVSTQTPSLQAPRFPFKRFKKMYDPSPEHSNLQMAALRTVATIWPALTPTDKEMLADFPQRLRSELLPMLSHRGYQLPAQDFDILTRCDINPIHELDLGGLIGHGELTLPVLLPYFRPRKRRRSSEDMVVDDWETSIPDIPPAMTSGNRFDALTHLCLSHPPPSVRWQHLLDLTTRTPKLTHLSLAYWPRPTLTPNLLTASVTDARGLSVDAGGSGYYSDYDTDVYEPAILLRKLSADLLSLRFLDIEGNSQWIIALAIEPSSQRRAFARTMVTNWRSLERIHCEAIPEELRDAIRYSHLRGEPVRVTADNFSETLARARRLIRGSFDWWQLVWLASLSINSDRRDSNVSPVKFDFSDIGTAHAGV